MRWNSSPSAEQDDLARFVISQCTSQAFVDILNKAKDELMTLCMDPTFNGYASGSKAKVYTQVNALYNVLHRHQPEVVWSIDPQGRYTEPLKQSIRTLDGVIQERAADCIDIVAIFCSLLIKVGLNPLIAVVGPSQSNIPTHAILGYWLDDRQGLDVKLQWPDVKPHLDDIAFLEATGVLRGPKKPFMNASAEALASLPRDVRIRVPMPPNAIDYTREFLSAPDSKVFYMVDVRRWLTGTAISKPVIAILGAKGGVGKGSITACMAELIAETKHNVLIIDLDLGSSGSTSFHSDRAVGPLPQVKTVYEHLLPYSATKDSGLGSPDERLWQVTPFYLKEKGLGEIYLVPALPTGAGNRFGIIADIDKEKRNEILRKEVRNIIQRAEMAEHKIDCVICDCGADINPIYSAAFDLANYAFIVATPEKICFENIDPIRRTLLEDFPRTNLRKMRIIVNRITSEAQVREAIIARWVSYHPTGFIPEDPEFQRSSFLGRVDFDLGYDQFTNAIREILQKTLEGADAELVPTMTGPLELWWDQIVNRRLPQRILASASFRAKTLFYRVLPVLALVAVILLGYINFHHPSPAGAGEMGLGAKVAIIELDSKEEAERLLKDIQEGSDFPTLAKEFSTHSQSRLNNGVINEPIGQPDELPGIGDIPGLTDCVKDKLPGSVCDQVLSSGGKFYIVKTVDNLARPSNGSDGLHLVQVAISTGLILALIVLAFSLILLLANEKKRILLVRVAREGGNKDFLRALVQRSLEIGSKDAIKWLHSLVEKAEAEEKMREEHRRYGSAQKR